MRCVLHALSLWNSTTTWHSQETRHQVAIKVVRRDILTAKLLDNLQSEIEILKSLSHRHITKLIDIVVSAPSLFMRSQLLLRSLRQRVACSHILSSFCCLSYHLMCMLSYRFASSLTPVL